MQIVQRYGKSLNVLFSCLILGGLQPFHGRRRPGGYPGIHASNWDNELYLTITLTVGDGFGDILRGHPHLTSPFYLENQ